jgi:hypothetical protein
MSDQMENAVFEKGLVYTRKAATLPASFASITVNNIVGKLLIIEQLDPNTRCIDPGPFQVARQSS